MNEDFDFNELMGDNEMEKKLEAYRQKMIEEAINENYRRIETNGLSEFHMRHLETSELIALKQTLNTMLEYFVDPDIEAYEKCAVISKEISKIEYVLSLKDTADI